MANSDFYFYLLIILGVLLLLIVPVQWITNFYYGLKGGMFSGFGLSLLFAFGGLYLYQWGKGVGSVTGYVSYASGELRMIFLGLLLGSLILIAITNFGIYHLVLFSKTGILNKPAFFIWLVLYAGGPALFIGIKEYRLFLVEKEQQTYFIPAYIKAFHYRDFPVYIDELKFVNSTNGRESTFRVSAVSKFYKDDDENSKKHIREADHVLIDRRESIPVDMDQFILSWYSYVEETCYSDTFPFPAEHFPIKIWPDGSRTMSGIDLLIQPGGKVRLFAPGNKQLFPYHKVETKPLSEEEKEQKTEALFSVNQGLMTREDLKESLESIRTSDRLNKRLEMEEKEFFWNLTVEGPGEVSSVTIHDFRYLRYETTYRWLHEVSEKILPAEISMYFRNQPEGSTRIYLFLDKEKLYHQVEMLTVADKKMPVEFSIIIPAEGENNISVLINAGDERVPFDHFETNVVKYTN